MKFGPTRKLARVKIAMVIVKCEGNLVRSSQELGVGRSTMYRLLERYRLHAVVNEARIERALSRKKQMEL